MSKKSNKYLSSIPKVRKSGVDIVIPVYRRFDLLQKCIDAIPAACGNKSYTIYLVDNASPREEADVFYSALNSSIRVIRNKENLGFPRACNQGARRGTSPNIFFLNSDVILFPGSIDLLIGEMEDSTTGICGMKLVFPDAIDMQKIGLNTTIRPERKIQHVGLMTNIRGDFAHAFIGWDADHPKPNSMRDMYAVTGAALMIRRSLFTKVGDFNEVYGQGTFEDIDLCLTVRELGYNVIVNTLACGIHYTGATAETYRLPYSLDYNRMTFLQRWSGKLNYTEINCW